jgi:2-iminobutanoate/2-iminopropanoate deaminase
MKKIIETKKAPAAIGPYSQAVSAGSYMGARPGKFVFVSGQLPINAETGLFVGEDAAGQAKQCLENISAILSVCGASLENVVKTTVYLINMEEEFSAVNEVYAEFFKQNPPARACVEVSRLPKNAKVEIECIAFVG